MSVRRYAVVALTNLTFGNATIKSFLCHMPNFVSLMVGHLRTPLENLQKATAHLFRNLAWKADKQSKHVLSECGVVHVLLTLAMDVAFGRGSANHKEESMLKVVLSALWNLSSHCGKNKVTLDSFALAPFYTGIFPSMYSSEILF
jgi:hypothetical protein